MTTTPEYDEAIRTRLDAWIPANGGTETPFTTRTNDRVLYCFNPATGKHAYLDCGSDTTIEDSNLFAYGLV